MNQKLNHRNLLLLAGASEGLTLGQINDKLDKRLFKSICALDWALWTNFYYPLAKNDIVYEREIIYNNRSLSWFATDLKQRHQKQTIS